MANLNVKKGDAVKVIAGREKNKSGVITSVNPTDGSVVIEGLQMVSHFVKPRNAQEKGGIIKKSAAMDVSNVAIICASCSKTTRVAHKIEIVDGKEIKTRVCKHCGASLEVKSVEAKSTAKKAAKKAPVKKAAAKSAE